MKKVRELKNSNKKRRMREMRNGVIVKLESERRCACLCLCERDIKTKIVRVTSTENMVGRCHMTSKSPHATSMSGKCPKSKTFPLLVDPTFNSTKTE